LDGEAYVKTSQGTVIIEPLCTGGLGKLSVFPGPSLIMCLQVLSMLALTESLSH
jgi:hypothetical protein